MTGGEIAILFVSVFGLFCYVVANIEIPRK